MPVRARLPRPRPDEVPGAEPFLPVAHTLPALRAAIPSCHGCTLYKNATQAVFGEGLASAKVMLIGEVPGDYEDLAGKPFVGPSGRLLDEALALAKIPRAEVYVTNAVKHFKWTPRGKRRLHEKPNGTEVAACRHWLELELRLVRPDLVVALGATAAQALLGPAVRVTRDRGKVRSSPLAPRVVPTVHPSSILRAPDRRDEEMAAFVKDLRAVARLMRAGAAGD